MGRAVVESDDNWVEVDDRPGSEGPLLPGARRFSDQWDRPQTQTAYAPCRCWRCRGSVPAADRAVLDRALARHLARMGWQEREEWLSLWSLNPRHSLVDVAVIRRWVDIEMGQQLTEPVYMRSTA